MSNLKPAELERLAIQSEELGEAQQIIGKIIRHGLDSRNPLVADSPTNRQMLESELGDVLAAIELLTEIGVVNRAAIDEARARKLERIGRWIHHHLAPRLMVYNDTKTRCVCIGNGPDYNWKFAVGSDGTKTPLRRMTDQEVVVWNSLFGGPNAE